MCRPLGGAVRCQRCGVESAQSVCALCGSDSPRAGQSKDVAGPHSGERTVNLFAAGYEHQARGVGGWLAFFCLTLTLFGPVTNLRIATKALINLAVHPISLPTEFRLASVAVVYAGLSIFSVLAGYRLWREEPDAPQFTKNYLIISTACVVALHVILYSVGIHVDLLTIVIGRLSYCAIWYSYLQVSRRVQATYAVG
jgi:hypothetical protein